MDSTSAADVFIFIGLINKENCDNFVFVYLTTGCVNIYDTHLEE
jgi:hypothetical protein